jgi:hypothetical protein
MKQHKQNGFAHLLIFIVILVVVAAAGAYVFIKNKQDSGISSTPVPQPKQTEEYNWSTMSEGPYKDKVFFTTSNSLEQWPNSGKQLAAHASVPEVILKNGVLYVYFVDVSEDGKPEQIGLLQSYDNGANWGKKQIINIDGVGDKIAVDPDPYLLPDGRIRLYYFDISTTKTESLDKNTIYSAISDDGVNFIQEEGVRFTYPAIFDPDVIYTDGTWRMYVGTDDSKVLLATSDDGLNFSHKGIALNDGVIPNVIYENSKYYMFTGGIELSTSVDGNTFTKVGAVFNSGSNITADPGVAKLDNGQYLMVYKTKD